MSGCGSWCATHFGSRCAAVMTQRPYGVRAPRWPGGPIRTPRPATQCAAVTSVLPRGLWMTLAVHVCRVAPEVAYNAPIFATPEALDAEMRSTLAAGALAPSRAVVR
jgi:hypothetical protein